MITNIFLLIIFFFGRFLLGLFPTGSLPETLTDNFREAASLLNSFNNILPLNTLFTILGLTISIELIIALYKLIRWTYQKIPGIN
jgi:hypothetical protein